jgi:hypothetical protein
MMATTILSPYYAAMEEWFRAELNRFQDGALPRADIPFLDFV